MTREWEPGDVAMVTYDNRPGETVTEIALRDPAGGWSLSEKLAALYDADVSTARPLVVIDPETILPTWGANLLPSLLEASAEIVAESVAPRVVHETALLLNLAKAFDAALEPPGWSA